MPLIDGKHVCAKRGDVEFALPGAERHYPPDLELEPVHLDIDLSVDLDRQAISGVVTSTVEARRAGPRTLALNAVDLAVEAVEDADGHSLSWSYDGDVLRATWAEPFSSDEARRLAVRYEVERPVTGLFFSGPGQDYPDAPWFAATDHETERARHWLPCVDHPSVRPRLDFRLRAASRFTILANGEEVSETVHEDGTTTVHWRLDHPCPSYLTCFAIGDFVRHDDGELEGRPIAYFTTREFTSEDLARTFGRTPAMLRWLTETLSPEAGFPYPKYFQFAVDGIGGAMENISLVSWDSRFVLDETLATEWRWLVDQVNIHEMAHSFFGDWVVCRDFAHAWLKESWATYIETCWLEAQRGAEEAEYDFYANAHAYFREADERYQRPIVCRVFDHSWNLYDMHLYPGGACRLHMLRKLVGDEPFWEAVRDYIRTFGGGVVETDDFRRVMEAHSGRSLGRFFDQWLHSKGYPKLKVEYEYDSERKEVRLKLTQTQVDEKKEIPAFALRLEIEWIVDGERHRRVVDLETRTDAVVLPAATEPELVLIDRQGQVLMRLDFNPGDGLLRRQLRFEENVIPRIRAGRELAKTGRRRNIAAVAEAYRAEPFWGVRVQLARALGRAQVQAAADALAELVGLEQDPMALASLMAAAGEYRDPKIVEALSARLEGELPYRAKAAALEALGAQRENAPLDRLETESDREGFGGHVQGGALRGLAATREAAALERLIARTAFGRNSHHTRRQAALALGNLGRVLEKRARERAVECLVDLLRDPHQQVRTMAVRGLQKMGAEEASRALRAHRKAISEQERATVDRVLAQLRAGDTPRAQALEKQVESLEDRLRKLEGLVRKLEARLEPEPGTSG